MVKRVCDICDKNFPDARIRYKARRSTPWGSWEKIELCNSCLQLMINLNENKRGVK